jgi:hypothetical protein
MGIEQTRTDQLIIVIVRILGLNVFEMNNQLPVRIKGPEMVSAAIQGAQYQDENAHTVHHPSKAPNIKGDEEFFEGAGKEVRLVIHV